MKKYVFAFATLILAIGVMMCLAPAAVAADNGDQFIMNASAASDTGSDAFMLTSDTEKSDEGESEGQLEEQPSEEDEKPSDEEPIDEEKPEDEKKDE